MRYNRIAVGLVIVGLVLFIQVFLLRSTKEINLEDSLVDWSIKPNAPDIVIAWNYQTVTLCPEANGIVAAVYDNCDSNDVPKILYNREYERYVR